MPACIVGLNHSFIPSLLVYDVEQCVGVMHYEIEPHLPFHLAAKLEWLYSRRYRFYQHLAMLQCVLPTTGHLQATCIVLRGRACEVFARLTPPRKRQISTCKTRGVLSGGNSEELCSMYLSPLRAVRKEDILILVRSAKILEPAQGERQM